MGSISVAGAEFSFDAFKVLKTQHANENIFFCPLSVISTLAMVYLGARGTTQSQMAKVLHFDNITGIGDTSDSQEKKAGCTTSCTRTSDCVGQDASSSRAICWCGTSEFHKSLKDLLSDISKPNDSYSLKIADRLYIEKKYPILPEYLECVRQFYDAELKEVDFKTATEEARRFINSWVEEETNGEIQDFLVSGAVDPDTALVVVNAVYFKGIWKSPFKEEDTREVPFNVTEQESKPVQMMCQNGTFRVSVVTSEKMKILELPYASGDLSMLILLPDDISGLEQIENKISFEKLMEWISPNVMEKKRVKVYLPRMKIEEKYNFTSVLMTLGMTDLFSPSANLSGISSAENLKVSEAIHEARMEVNEEGTSMASSADVVGDTKYSPEIEEFRADHPFLFLIRYNPTSSILFLGRFSSP